MVHDLEEVLAIEAARTGQTHRRGHHRAPVALGRHRRLRADPAQAAEARARVHAARAGAPRRHRGLPRHPHREGHRRPRREEAARAAPRSGSPATRRSDYDPQGDNRESPDAARNAIDGNLGTNWNTETYQGGFEGSNKSGVGLYVDAGSLIRGRGLTLATATPGLPRRGLRVRDGAGEPARLDAREPGPDRSSRTTPSGCGRAGGSTATTCSGSAGCPEETRRRSRSCRSCARATPASPAARACPPAAARRPRSRPASPRRPPSPAPGRCSITTPSWAGSVTSRSWRTGVSPAALSRLLARSSPMPTTSGTDTCGAAGRDRDRDGLAAGDLACRRTGSAR